MSRMNNMGGDGSRSKQGMMPPLGGGSNNAAAIQMGRTALAYPNAPFPGVPMAGAPHTVVVQKQKERLMQLQLQHQHQQLELQMQKEKQHQHQQQQQQHQHHHHHHHHQQHQQQQQQQHQQQHQQHHQQHQHHHQFQAQYLQQNQRQGGSSRGNHPSPRNSMTRPPDFTSPVNSGVVTKPGPPIGPLSSITSAPTLAGSNHKPTSSSPSSSSAVTPVALKRDSSTMAANVPLTPEKTEKLLQLCDVKDKIVYLSRQIQGGSTVNGFSRAISNSQRVKKLRARQKKQQANSAANKEANNNNNNNNSSSASSSKAVNEKSASVPTNTTSGGATAPETEEKSLQQQEEDLKKDAMNTKTAKKIRAELTTGLEFCKSLHETVRSILRELEPSFVPVPLMDTGPILNRKPPQPTTTTSTNMAQLLRKSSDRNEARSSGSTLASTKSSSSTTTATATIATAEAQTPSPSTISPGDPSGSTLRKSRKRKFSEVANSIKLPEHDDAGKRVVTKKEHAWRIFELCRFRALDRNDFVAAKVSSRDLWILAKVIVDYPALDLEHMEFLQLKGTKRDSLFHDKVIIKDVEEKEGGNTNAVARHLVLPLPRSYEEAAEWGARCKKGSRVYAMYPQTTSLYSGTVVDNTTYCRGEDDIIVVEFDEDEYDATGSVKQYHIPARFVTLIPREFPASQKPGDKTTSGSTGKKKRLSLSSPSSATKRRRSSSNKNDSDSQLNEIMTQFYEGSGEEKATDLDLDILGFDLT